MKSNSRSPYVYGAGGCLFGVIFMVCSVATLAILGPADIPPFLGTSVASFINIGSWLVPIAFGVLGYIWGKRRKANQELSGEGAGGDDRAADG
jgi:hypothetical protein